MALTINRRTFIQGAAIAGASAGLPLRARAASPLTMQAAWINDAEFRATSWRWTRATIPKRVLI